MPSKNLTDSTFTIRAWDGNALVSAAMKVGSGNFTWTEAQNLEYTPNKGKVAPHNDGGTVRRGDDTPLAVSFDIVFEEYVNSDATIYSPVELLHTEFRASADDTCGPSSVDLIIDTTASCASGSAEKLTFPRFRWESLNFDLEQGQISCSGNCLAKEPVKE